MNSHDIEAKPESTICEDDDGRVVPCERATGNEPEWLAEDTIKANQPDQAFRQAWNHTHETFTSSVCVCVYY